MVKTPKTRHSKPRRDAVTIEHEPTSAVDPSSAEAARFDHADPAVLADETPVTAPDLDADALIDTGTTTTETGTATVPDQEYRPAEPEPAAAGYGFEENVRTATSKETGSPPRDDDRPPVAVRPQSSDGIGRVAAGVVGGVVALAIAGALQWAGVLGSPDRPVAGDAMQADIAALRQEIDTVRDTAPGDFANQIDELKSRLDAVIGDVSGLQQAVSAGSSGDAAGVQALDARLKALESAGGGAASGDIAAMGERISAAETLEKATSEANAAVEGRLATLEQSVSGMSAKVEAQAAQPKIALAIATAALKAAMDRGAAFSAELETFAAVMPSAPELSELRAHAEKGVSTRQELVELADGAVAAMIASANPADPDAGVLDRLIQSAESLVAVRPVGDVEGTGVPEIAARMDAALRAGDLDKAILEYDALPDAAKAAGGDFGAKLKARRDVEVLVDQAIANAMKA